MPPRSRILPILALLMVACAQIFGLQRGYVCEHGGKVIETMADHHHRGGGMHEVPEAHHHHHHHHGEEPDDGDTEHHAPLKVEMNVAQSPAAASAPAAVAWAIERWLQDHFSPGALEQGERYGKELWQRGERSPPAALIVVRAVVLLV